MFNPIAQEMIDNRKLFLSNKAVNSFAGYTAQQLKRLQHVVDRDALCGSKSMWANLTESVKLYINKHAMHLIRLYI